MRKFGIALAAGLLLGSAPAMAVPTITFTTGSGALGTTIGGPTFSQNFGTGATGASPYVAGPGEEVGVLSAPGAARLVGAGTTIPGLGISTPANSAGNFLAILEGGTYKINFGTAMSALTFVLGSLDASNYVTLNYAGGTSETLSGSALAGGAALGSEGLVRYDFGLGPQITSVLFGNNQSAGATTFTLDTIAAAAPEPATWLMMILGFGMVGGALRNRRRTAKLATA